jgi:hypothetical protein
MGVRWQPRVMRGLVLALSLAASGCDRTSPVEPVSLGVPAGTWSSHAARLEVTDSEARVTTRRCLHGFFERPVPDSSGRFVADGRYTPDTAHPRPEGPVPAQLVGSLRGRRVVFVVKEAGETIAGPFEVAFGETMPPPPPCPM